MRFGLAKKIQVDYTVPSRDSDWASNPFTFLRDYSSERSALEAIEFNKRAYDLYGKLYTR